MKIKVAIKKPSDPAVPLFEDVVEVSDQEELAQFIEEALRSARKIADGSLWDFQIDVRQSDN